MKKILLVLLVLTSMVSITACQKEEQKTKRNDITSAEKAESNDGGIQAEDVLIGDVITTDFIEMSIDEGGIKNDLKISIKKSNFTYTSGPDESESAEFVYIRGKLKNISKSKIDNAYIGGIVEIDGYEYEIDDLSIIKADGQTAYSMDPLVEYTYTAYAEVPNELAQSGKEYTIQFGFNELMKQDYNEENFEYNYKFTGV